MTYFKKDVFIAWIYLVINFSLRKNLMNNNTIDHVKTKLYIEIIKTN